LQARLEPTRGESLTGLCSNGKLLVLRTDIILEWKWETL
jgi:hypothetical protein